MTSTTRCDLRGGSPLTALPLLAAVGRCGAVLRSGAVELDACRCLLVRFAAGPAAAACA